MKTGLEKLKQSLKMINTVSKLIKVSDTVKKLGIILTAVTVGINIVTVIRK